MKCAQCDNGTLETGVVERTVKVGELSYTAEVPAKVCPRCGAYRLSMDTVRRLSAKIAADLAKEGVATPEVFRYLRKRLKLSAKELATLLDVTPETVSRWENGKHPMDLRALKLLGAMVLDSLGERPGLLDYLRSLKEEREPRKLERRIPALSCLENTP
ncbi:MAG: helix-turn-helix domain-containing protein [Polyangia bacterium]|jgi:putative zinc finger/helix-turn-helix YgiT family protein|nr:helix-turn-helix domain-containing protein [Polyangia bacterium]